ncbi:MAG: hypothetical protein AAF393_06535 [Pseudomonadota bacterium]
MKTILSAMLSATLLAGAVNAQDVFCNFTGNSIDFRKFGAEIDGAWNFTGVGKRVATGVTKDSFVITTNRTGTQATISGGGGPTLQLHPLSRAKLSEVPVTRPMLQNKKLVWKNDENKEVEQTVDYIAEVAGCPLDGAPAVYFYKDFGGGNSAYGAFMFLSSEFGVGVVSNSAKGARTVFLSR